MILKNMFCNDEFLTRFKQMITTEQLNNLTSAKVIVFGVGGVGSALCNFLVRSGIYNLDLVDYDTIDITNINRQLVANQQNVGKLKVEELKNQLLTINLDANINIFPIKFSQETSSLIDLSKYDYIVDCIDDISAKELLIKYAKQLNIPILCAMGAGNRFEDVPQFEITDISKTSYDPIAKILRKYCVQNGIQKLSVCYTKQKATKFDCQNIGSVVYYPISMASAMCSKVINDLLNQGVNNEKSR